VLGIVAAAIMGCAIVEELKGLYALELLNERPASASMRRLPNPRLELPKLSLEWPNIVGSPGGAEALSSWALMFGLAADMVGVMADITGVAEGVTTFCCWRTCDRECKKLSRWMVGTSLSLKVLVKSSMVR
jgi:hypothetical protein